MRLTRRASPASSVAGLALLALGACGGGSGGGGGGPSLGAQTHHATAITTIRGPGNEYGEALAVFDDGSTVVVGEHDAGAIFGPGELLQTTFPNYGSFVARYAANGTLSWVRDLPSSPGGYASGVVAYPDGSCVATGIFADTMTFASGEGNETTVGSGAAGTWVAKWNSTGGLVFAIEIPTPSDTLGVALSARAGGGFVLAGGFHGSMTLGSGEPNETTLTSADAGRDAFAAIYDSAGFLVDAVNGGGTGEQRAYAIATLSDGGFTVVGAFQTTITLGAGEPNETTLASSGADDLFVARFAANGDLAWARRFGGTTSTQFDGLTRFANDDVALTGSIDQECVFDGSTPAQATIASTHPNALFLARYTAAGEVAWAHVVAEADDILRNPGVAAGADGTIAVVTCFWAPTTIDPSGVAAGVTPSSVPDGLFLQWNGDGTFGWARTISGGGLQQPGAVAAGADLSWTVLGIADGAFTWNAGGPDAKSGTVTPGGAADTFVLRLTHGAP